jgi:hypothetical protein
MLEAASCLRTLQNAVRSHASKSPYWRTYEMILYLRVSDDNIGELRKIAH